MKMIRGIFNGTGAAVTLGIGFIPDFVNLFNLEDGDLARYVWKNDFIRCAELSCGLHLLGSSAAEQLDARTISDTGITTYRGGDKMTASSTAYLVKNKNQAKRANAWTEAAPSFLDTWTLDTAANRTGHWNAECNTTHVGEGSKICIDGIWYGIQALTSNGEQTDEVTLSLAAPSGVIQAVSCMYDYVGAAVNDVIPAGFTITPTTVINVSGEMVLFEAGLYDN